MIKIPIYEIEPDPEPARMSMESRLAWKMGRPPGHVINLTGSMTVNEFLSFCPSGKVCLIFDPNFWYPEYCWNQWLKAVEQEGGHGKISVPLGNQDPSWKEGLQIPLYLTVSGLERTAGFRGPDKWMIRKAVSPETFCVAAIPVRMIENLPKDMALSDLPGYLTRKRVETVVFCRGWLHSFSALKYAGCRYDLLAMTDWKGRVLEFGCGRGLMARTCKDMGNEVLWVGLDFDHIILREARQNLDLGVLADASLDLPVAVNCRFDRIVCGDFLEHLCYPWIFLGKIRQLIASDGQLIASVPNVGHWSIVEDLLNGRFDEAPAGTMCVTHLRFGTKSSWGRWLEEAKWKITRWEEERLPLPEKWHSLIDKPGFLYDRDSLETYRYRILAEPKVDTLL